ncbi:winged helix-turn-helix transcriptional regulator [Natronobiforma cellulositropha]|uniref:winged helix-turn-helix transcriptional regulator n=1 Tax=Natronobiforma cellulositropha TaxID=1679076 RepID=UPI0021D60CE7|nr:winged helix-turn-helix transcriptional regulator [Natronobiforma cellulositropha]
MVTNGIDVPSDDQMALDVLSLLSKKWHPVVVVVLAHEGPLGFNDLLESIPDISGKVLSGTLEALGEAGLIERTVVSESPLRVRYELTEAGWDLDPVFSALTIWGERHLETSTPTVLVADADRRITDMYGQWLTDRYTISRAHNGDELAAAVGDGSEVDVVLFDEGLPGVEPAETLTSLASTCRTVVLVGDRPGFDLLEFDCDDVLRKPIVRETALESVEAQLSRRGEPDSQREHAALSAKCSLLESAYPRETLAANDAYVAACERLAALEDA